MNVRSIVIGDVMLDEYIEGTCDRISPEAPVPIVRIKSETFKLGGAANVAIGIASLGGTTKILGNIGDDELGKIVKSKLEAGGVSHDFVVDKKFPTILKSRVIVNGHQLLRIDREADLIDTGKLIFNKLKNCQTSFKVIVLSDYNKGSLLCADRVISYAVENEKFSIVDPKVSNWEKYRGCDLITPNLNEFKLACELESLSGNLEDCAQKLIENYKIKSILLTLGSEGMQLFRSGIPTFSINSAAQEVYDVTGAGDTVVATVAHYLSEGAPIEEAVKSANNAAAIAVSKIGTHAVTKDEISKYQNKVNEPKYDCKIVKIKKLLEELRKLKNINCGKIGFTNGCFDIIHSGHIRYLDECKNYSDKLIVGVNSDKAVSKLKGKNRPILDIESRCELLAAISSVDYVVVFDEDTPEKIIKLINPDVLMKGGDYKIEEIIGSDFILNNGGEVHSLKFHKEKSTSLIIDKIQRLKT